MGRIGSNKSARGMISLHYVVLCAIIWVNSTAGIRVSIPHRQTEKLKISLPITLRIEAPPNFQPELSPSRNISAELISLPAQTGYNLTAEGLAPLKVNIPFALPQFLGIEKLQNFETALEQRLENEGLIPSQEAVLEDEDCPVAKDKASDPEAENKTNRTAHLLTEDGKIKLFIAPAVMQAATKLFTYALGMNMTANKGRKPICDCGKRRLDGVYPSYLKTFDDDRLSQRISGGAEAIPNEFPWRVGLQGSPNGVFCGGSIIDNGWIVTAAHCLHDLDPNTVIYVNAGDHDITTVTETDNVVIRASGWTIHPEYDPYTQDNNIALIRLQRDLVYRDNIQPICLPYKLLDDNFTGATAVTGGWGSRSEDGPPSKVLRRVDLPVLSAHQIRDYTREIVTDNMIGTMMAGRDACSGDLGGTLDFFDSESGRYQAIGIASHGDGCARVNSPRIYTKMTNYLEYIHGTTRAAFCVK